MEIKRNSIAGILLLFVLLLSMAGCSGKGKQDAQNEPDSQGGEAVQAGEAQEVETDILYTIGVAVFSQDNPEMKMFMNYYRDYIEEGFPVKFYFSDTLSSAEDENEFIRAMKEQGAQGVISFYGLDIQNTVKVCEEEEIYYVLGSGTLSDEDFQAVKDNPWFLGTVGPDPDREYQAGKDMASYFAAQGMKSYLILTGGSSTGNFMHASRTQGILDGLAQAEGLTFDNTAAVLAAQESNTILSTGKTDISITLCPGYMSDEVSEKNLEDALAAANYDAVLCSFGVSSFLDKITEKEKEQNSDIQVGTVDCFSEENFQVVKENDDFGNPRINYVEGKYASMVGPAFSILYNAMSGYPEANSGSGEAVRLYQGFWQAKNRQEYAELFGYTQGIYENAYDCDDLMSVIRVFNEAAGPEELKTLTEAYTIEDVKERILSH